MKNIMKLLAIVGIAVGISSQAEGHKVVCIESKQVSSGQETDLRCRYHHSYPADGGQYMCYIKFNSGSLESSAPTNLNIKWYNKMTGIPKNAVIFSGGTRTKAIVFDDETIVRNLYSSDGGTTFTLTPKNISRETLGEYLNTTFIPAENPTDLTTKLGDKLPNCP